MDSSKEVSTPPSAQALRSSCLEGNTRPEPVNTHVKGQASCDEVFKNQWFLAFLKNLVEITNLSLRKHACWQ